MSTLPATDQSLITDADDLAAWFAAGAKPKARWRIGTEHEKFCIRLSDGAPVPYEGGGGVAALLEQLCRFGWNAIRENGNLIGLTRNGAGIALEPGGQIELSGAPLADLHATDREIGQHLAEIRQIAEPMGIGLLGLGFQPWATADQLPWVPKERYGFMRDFMAKTGTPKGRGLDMMQRTASIQVNLDFANERDMAMKIRAGMALQPLSTALFAASPLVDGQVSGFKSWRMHVWSGTDPLRTGLLPSVFDRDFGFESYTDYALNRPMYFLWRDGRYIGAGGRSFRDFMANGLPGSPRERPTFGDWELHLSTLFPDVRLRRYIELRAADCGPRPHLTALPAFWTGLLYDKGVLDQVLEMVREWPVADILAVREDAAKDGLAATIKGRPLQDVALDVLKLAREGLKRRAVILECGVDESRYLEPLFAIAESGETVADAILKAPEPSLLEKYRL